MVIIILIITIILNARGHVYSEFDLKKKKKNLFQIKQTLTSLARFETKRILSSIRENRPQ